MESTGFFFWKELWFLDRDFNGVRNTVLRHNPFKVAKRIEAESKGGLEYREKKNALKANAQRMFPKLNPTLETSDALLIAEYGRQAALNELKTARGQ